MYNYMLDLQKKRYEAGEKHLSAFSMIKLITPLKKQEEYEWLCRVSTTSMQRVCQDLANAYENFSLRERSFLDSKAERNPEHHTRSGKLCISLMGKHR